MFRDISRLWIFRQVGLFPLSYSNRPSFVELPILNFKTDTENGIITLEVSGENLNGDYFLNNTSASVALFVSDGNNSFVSDYVPMIPDVYSDYTILYTTNDNNVLQKASSYANEFWDNVIANTYLNGQGRLTFRERNLTVINSHAFDSCSTLCEITIPNGVTSIGFSAFGDCSNLAKIVIPNSVESIGDLAFYRCAALSSITIPSSVSSIGSGAFSNCTSLSNITIPENVISIGANMFPDCTSLKTVFFKSIYPPTIIGGNILTENSDLTIYVPNASLDAYKSADGWERNSSQIVGYDF